MTRPEKVVAAWDTGLSDFDIMTLTLNQVPGGILGGRGGALLQREQTRSRRSPEVRGAWQAL